MATTTRDIRVNPDRGQRLPRPRDRAANLPLDLCDECEQALYGVFEEAARDDETQWKSPERRARETARSRRPATFVCRHCGRVARTLEPGGRVVAQAGRLE